ncbi:MAG: hypothetical protein EZS28_038048 [Streblomastix strix]|uniref:Uncharacterized protein n=1 Tax=Streblomastix strix TaxID=222440 RepID=A0A5J4U768_9EUKA|nr:MAG: hypothetical protein EZS28_038048 [Streblomastix strix]
MIAISVQEYMCYCQFLQLLVSQATKADPEIELRFLLRQFNRRLRMDQLKEIIEIAKQDNQQAALKLMEYLNK